jgi:putative transcriptional regulator
MECEGDKSGSAVPACCKGAGSPKVNRVASNIRKSAALCLTCILLGLPPLSALGAQKKSEEAEFLVARREIQDPFFERSVVFMLPGPKVPLLVIGLIIDKPTRVTLSKLFPNTPEFSNRAEPAYFGGPVDISVPSVVFRSSTVPQHAVQLYGDVYLTFDHDLISRIFQNSQQASKPRMFLGRAQWAPGQLENEIQQGSWYKIQADGDLIFSSQPEGLWRTLHDRAAHSKYIRYRLPSGSPRPTAGKSAVM